MEADFNFARWIAVVIIAVILIGGIIIFTYQPPAAASVSTVPGIPPSAVPARGPPAPELQGISSYINSPSFQLRDYIGKKVILIDFWTYTCINCVRTFPYLNSWQKKYADQGLLIVGVHSPEFEFEKEPANVQAAVSKYNIRYPVVLDNDHATWNAYQNRYWPAEYLIDKNGQIVYTHFGEGQYEETEAKIVELLQGLHAGNASSLPSSGPINATPVDFNQIGTPELYFGHVFRRQPLGNEPSYMLPDQAYDFTLPSTPGPPPSSLYPLPSTLYPNTIYLSGRWINRGDRMELVSDNGSIILKYHAKAVYLVMAGNATGQVFIDGQPIATSLQGSDVQNGTVHVDSERMYVLVQGPAYETHTLELRVSGSGLRAYAFTFG